MKMKRRHIVLLSIQARAILDELRSITGARLFPSPRDNDHCMSKSVIFAGKIQADAVVVRLFRLAECNNVI